ncbi:MAG TPA: hypothetical protein PKD05_23925, partial [Candidatus Melainabacteria bacterium]|nr:hypothetical protein [Candidatus Melainabacteria bacterium]
DVAFEIEGVAGGPIRVAVVPPEPRVPPAPDADLSKPDAPKQGKPSVAPPPSPICRRAPLLRWTYPSPSTTTSSRAAGQEGSSQSQSHSKCPGTACDGSYLQNGIYTAYATVSDFYR